MFQKIGLFVSVDGNQLAQRTIVTRAGTAAFPDTTIADEILRFTEIDLAEYRAFANEIEELADNCIILSRQDGRWTHHVDHDRFSILIRALYDGIAKYEKQDPFNGGLLHVLADYRMYFWTGVLDESFDAVDTLKYSLDQVIGIHMEIMDALSHMARGTQPEPGVTSSLVEGEFHQILTYDGTLKEMYRFFSHEDYFSFLMMRFMAGNPHIQQCQHCGRYFIPKTNRKTLYCSEFSYYFY